MAVMPMLWPGASAAAAVVPAKIPKVDPPSRSAKPQAPLIAPRGLVSVDRGLYELGATPPLGGRGASCGTRCPSASSSYPMAVSIEGIDGAVARLVHTNALELDDDALGDRALGAGEVMCCLLLREPHPPE